MSHNPGAFTWPSSIPADCPWLPSAAINTITFTGRHANYTNADTWYLTWADDGHLYSPWTDGYLLADGHYATLFDESHPDYACNSLDFMGRKAATAQARIEGSDPLALRVVNLPPRIEASPLPYGGRYPCGSLIHNGIWYYGTYCLADGEPCGGVGWTKMGPFIGFRLSLNYGHTWNETRHTPTQPLFPGDGQNGAIQIGAPHFVDFGQNMQSSPDGYAYIVAHGTTQIATCNSWIQGDAVYLFRVLPSPGTINDHDAYQFYGGMAADGTAIWTSQFQQMQPLLAWEGHLGCVTMTYNAPLQRYLLCVTRGVSAGHFTTSILEAPTLTGPWHIITRWEDFGPEAYFVTIPTKFIAVDGRTCWLTYSANWSDKNQAGNPPGSHYALSLHEIVLGEAAQSSL